MNAEIRLRATRMAQSIMDLVEALKTPGERQLALQTMLNRVDPTLLPRFQAQGQHLVDTGQRELVAERALAAVLADYMQAARASSAAGLSGMGNGINIGEIITAGTRLIEAGVEAGREIGHAVMEERREERRAREAAAAAETAARQTETRRFIPRTMVSTMKMLPRTTTTAPAPEETVAEEETSMEEILGGAQVAWYRRIPWWGWVLGGLGVAGAGYAGYRWWERRSVAAAA